MDKVENTSLISEEPQTSILISGLSKEARESITDVMRLVIEDISHNHHFGGKSGKAQTIRDLHRFLIDYEITAPHKGQVPDLSTQMQDKRKVKFPHEAPVSESLSSTPDRQALPATGTWPTWIKSCTNVNGNLHQEGEINSTLEV